jgi:Na+-driven multidrug efflux pump
MFISNGVINGAGHTMITMTFTLLSLWLVRVPVSWWLSKTSLGIIGVWIAIALSFLTTMTVSLTYYYSGRWKKSTIIKGAAAVPAIG